MLSRKIPKASDLLRWLVLCAPAGAVHAQEPGALVDVQSVVPDVVLDMRYATADNFIGRRIPGYDAARCLLTRQAADALRRVQDDLRESGLSLKVYDCYRPQAAVDYFVAWARDPDDQIMKAGFYPSVDKQNLIRDGYIAERSGHGRGSTVDLTLVPVPTGQHSPDLRPGRGSCEEAVDDEGIDMGTAYDCFSELSHTLNPLIEPQQRANRLLLKELMESNGFRNLPEEWWHFTLSDEPYPATYFDFPIDRN